MRAILECLLPHCAPTAFCAVTPIQQVFHQIQLPTHVYKCTHKYSIQYVDDLYSVPILLARPAFNECRPNPIQRVRDPIPARHPRRSRPEVYCVDAGLRYCVPLKFFLWFLFLSLLPIRLFPFVVSSGAGSRSVHGRPAEVPLYRSRKHARECDRWVFDREGLEKEECGRFCRGIQRPRRCWDQGCNRGE